MADIESNINLDIDASGALASLKELQRQISVFQTTMAKTGAISNARLSDMQNNLVNSINATGQFTASIQRVKTTTESFTTALEKNKLSMGQYFRYSLGATKTFGRGFKTEFDTIEKVARERVKTLQTQYIKLGRDASGAMQAIAVRPQVLDMKDLGTQTAIAAQKAQLFNQLMSQGSTNLLNFGKNTQWAGRQLMVGFTIPLGIMGAAAAKEFKAIEEQVIRLERVYGDFTTTMADTEQITQQIKDLGSEFTKYGVAVSKTMGLAADAAAMGKTGADLVAQVAEANRLAVLGGVDQQQSLETTISLTNSFGVAADQLSGKINFLNAVENQTVTSIQDLTEAIPKAGPVVKQLGGNVEDLTFFLTAMKEGGINASEGANALKSGLASLINPTGEAVTMLEGFGINLQGIVEANKGNVKGIVIDFARALDTLDPLNRAQAIEQLFGKFQFSRLSTLFQNVIAEGSQASRVLDLTKSSAAELAALSERELGRIEASPLYKYQAAIENFKAAIAPVGEEFMKAVTPLINFGTQILEGFNGWSDGAKQFAVIAVGAIGAIGPVLLMTFGLLANGLANVVKGVLLVRNGFKGAGTQSNILTEQLNYMNTEQLEAASISASLNQVHNNLIQTFTSEAGAVRNLAGAYAQAIAVQGGFMGPITTRAGGMKSPKKLAEGGIISGPGTATSDSIPAMLSNGEAVISAGIVKKYPGLVNGLIAGNVGHFATAGIVGRSTPLAPNIGFGSRTNMANVEALLSALSNGTSGITNASAILEETLLRLSDKASVSLKELAREVMTVSKALNGRSVSIDKMNSLIGQEALKHSAVGQASVRSLASDPTMSEEVRRVQAAREAVRADKVARGLELKPTDSQIVRAHSSVVPANMKQLAEGWARPLWVLQVEEENQLSNLLAGTKKIQALSDDYMRLLAQSSATEQEKASIIHKINNNLALSDRELMIQRDILTQMQTTSAATLASNPKAAELVRGTIVAANAREQFGITPLSGTRDTVAAGAALSMATQRLNSNNPEGAGRSAFVAKSDVGQRLVAQVAESVNNASDANSPARRLLTASGKNIVDGAIIPIEQAAPRARKAGEEVAGQIAAGAQRAAKTIPSVAKVDPRIQHLQDKFPKIVGSVPNLRDAQISAYGGMNILKGDELKMKRGADLLRLTQSIKPMTLLGEAAQKTGVAITTATNNVKSFVTAVPSMTKTFITKVGDSFKQVGAAATAAAERAKSAWNGNGATIDPITGQRVYGGVKGKIMGGVGKVGAAGLTASMGLGMMSMMGGQGAEIAGAIAGPLMAISSIAQLLSMFPGLLATLLGPVGLVAAGVAALGVGLYAMHDSLVKTREAAKEAAEATAISTTNTQKFAEAAGTFDPIAMKNERDAYAAYNAEANAEPTWAKSFLESDPGKEMKASVEKAIAESGRSAAASQFANQLGTMVASGVLSATQAQDFAAQIGLSLKDKVLSAKITAELLSLIGPNGEDLTKEPMTVYTKLISTTGKDLKNSMETIANTGNALWGSEAWNNMVAAEQDAAVGFQSMVTQSGQLLANLDNVHDARIKELEAAGDLAGIQEENKTYDEKRQKLITQTTAELRKQLDAYNKLPKENQRGILSSAQDSLKAQYKDTELSNKVNSIISGLNETRATSYINDATGETMSVQDYVDLVNMERQNGGKSQTEKDFRPGEQYTQALTNEAQMVLTTNLSAGNISVEQFERLQKFIKPEDATSTPVYEAIANVSAKLSGDAAGQLTSILSQLDEGQEQVAIDIAANVNAKAEVDPTAAQNLQDTYQRIQEIAGNDALQIAVEWDDTKMAEFQGKLATIEALDGKSINSQYILSTFGISMSEQAAAWFDSLSPADVKTATYAILTVRETIDANSKEGRERLKNWWLNEGGKQAYGGGAAPRGKDGKIDWGKVADMYSETKGRENFEAGNVFTSTAPPPPNPYDGGSSGGGGGSSAPAEPEKPPTSFLDSVVKDMREFTTATQGLTENFADSMNAIRSSSASAFGGLSQQLRGVGIGEDVISLMTGMSKEEWDQYKGQFFNFDAAGNVTGFKADLTAIADKLRTITLGKFVDEQQKSLGNLAAQSAALTKLVSLGMSYANAYKLIEDAAFAAAVANAKSADEIRQIIALAEQARKAQSLVDASKGVAGTIADTDATVAGLDALIRFNSALTDTQTAAILADNDLQTMLANFDTLSIDQLKQLNEALKDAAEKEALEIKIKMQTKEGMQELFNDGLNKAMEQFSAKEQSVKIKFEALKNPFEDIIKSFSNQIDDMRNMPGGLDDLEADLQRISDQEIDINKKYEERYKALDSIAKINERVAAQQRTQLSLAEALSQGDIAAAARAAEEMRAQDAAQALTDQREALQKSQQLELENLTATMGMTREQLEASIRDIKRQIFEIEEQQIEPAQRQLDLLARQEEIEINTLTVAGKTKDEWDAIKNNIDLARTNSEQYNEAINLSLGLVQEIQNAWKEIEKPKQTIHTIIEKRISEAEAAAAQPAPAPVASTQPAPAAPADYHTEDYRNDMARRVIRGEFGNGQARKNNLGGDYQWIQDRVNDMVYHRNGYANGGIVSRYFANGGLTKPMFAPKGTDTVPAMLTPGEFVVKKWAVDRFGVGNLNAINQGNFGSGSVYNYNMSVNVRSDANPDEIARTVMAQIKRVDAQRIRGNRF